MNFASILSKISTIGQTVLGVERLAAPLGGLIPGAGSVLTSFDTLGSRFLNALGTAEAISPVGGGQIKANAVTADFEAALEVEAGIAEAEGKTVSYDNAMLQKAIADTIQGLNEFAQVKASIKFIPKS